MKKIFTLFVALFTSVALFAADARPKAIVSVTSFDRGSLRVVFDGRKFETGGNTISINDVEAGYHTIAVYREKSFGPLNLLGRRFEMIYRTSITVKPRTQVNLTIDRMGRTTLNETRLSGRDFDGNHDGYGRDDDHDRYDRDGDRNDRYDDRDGRYDDGRGTSSRSMTDREFDRVLESISCEWLESNKLKSATQVVSANLLSAGQVKQLMKLFNMESNKLELAKRAYMNTVDKNNYFIVSDELCFNSSKDELARFIRSCR